MVCESLRMGASLTTQGFLSDIYSKQNSIFYNAAE